MAAHRGQFVGVVQSNTFLCREHYRLTICLDAFPPTAPGQFVQVSCRNLLDDLDPQHELACQPGRPPDVVGVELTAPLAFLRRPFSLAGRRDTPAGVELDLIHRVVGVGTEWLSRLRTGAQVQLLGPLGNRFTMPAPGEIAVLVGGGVGIPPMLYLAEALGNRPAVAFAGALTRDLLPLTLIQSDPQSDPENDPVMPVMRVAEFARHGIPSVITTDDGSAGAAGFVTQALEQWLSRHMSPSHTPQPFLLTPHLFTCGPEPMMKRIAEMALARGLPCQIAVERAMACGMGTCQSCCIRVRKPDPSQPPLAGSDWCWRLACTDGPVFEARQLLW
jgi:dihydroorotate dehydrogenase electron transfer subunit